MSISVLAMAADSPDGASHPNAIWIPAQVIMDQVEMQGGVQWYAYHDAAAFIAKKSPIAGVQHHTSLDQALYAQVQALDTKTTIYGAATAYALVYLAKHYPDTPMGDTDPDTHQPILAPYFAAAQVVQIDIPTPAPA